MKNIKTSFKSFSDMLLYFSKDTICREFLEYVRWENEPTCPHCGCKDEKHYKLKEKGEFKGLRKCKDCRKRFTVTVGTIFHGSNVPLRKWFIAIYIFSSHKKGISSLQLGRDLGVTQKTAWFMLQRIRHTFGSGSTDKLKDIIQVDETFVGGKNKNRHYNKKVKQSQGRCTKDKAPVFGLVNNGKVTTKVVSDTKAKTLKPIIKSMVEKGSIVVTDEWQSYNGLAKQYDHKVVKHKKGKHISEGFHTNSIEGFWSLFKRVVYGIYHFTSPKHLSKYTTEFEYRYNTRQVTDSSRFSSVLFNSGNK